MSLSNVERLKTDFNAGPERDVLRVDSTNIQSYNRFMKKASITETKNNLSRLLEEVKSGTTILILDRNIPVARIEPVAADEDTNNNRIANLIRQGLVTAPKQHLDLQDFLTWERPILPDGVSAVQALIDEREQGR